METEGRATLKGYFQSRSFPTQDQFAQLIDSSLNLADDGVAVDGGGNLGVGTDAPAARLDVRGDLSRTLAGTVATTAGSAAVAGTGTAFTADLAPGVPVRIGAEDALVLAVASDTALTLDRPLTATATAAAVLAGGPLLAVSRATGDAALRVDAAGRVGVGTATPGAALDVAGTVRAAGFSGPGTGLTSVPSSALEGQVPAALVPPLDAAAIATGVLDPARLPPVVVPRGPLASSGATTTPLTGTVTVAAGSTAVVGGPVTPPSRGEGGTTPPPPTGVATKFLTEVRPGDAIAIAGETFTVAAVADDTHLTLDHAHTAGATDVPAYRDDALFSAATGAGLVRLAVDRHGAVSVGDATNPADVTVHGALTAASFAGSGAGLTGVPSAALEGQLPAALVPPLDASAIATGVLDPARLPPVVVPRGPLASSGETTTPLTGTVTVAAGSTAVVGGPITPPPTRETGGEGGGTTPPPPPPAGVPTKFLTEVRAGDAIAIAGETFTVAAVADDTHLTLDHAHAAGAADVPAYRDDTLFSAATGAGLVRLSVDRHGAVSVGDATTSADATVHGTLTATSFAGSGAGLTDIPATALTGELAPTAVPPLDAAALATGVLAPARIPPIDAATLTGVLDPARLPPIPASSVQGALVSRGATTVPLTGTVRVAPMSAQVVGGVATPPPAPPADGGTTAGGPGTGTEPVQPALEPTRFLSEVHVNDALTILGEMYQVGLVEDDANLSLQQGLLADGEGVQVFRAGTNEPLTGTVRVTLGSARVVGGVEPVQPALEPTRFLSEVRPGDAITIAGETFSVVSVEDDAHLTLSQAHVAGADGVQALRDADPLFSVADGNNLPRMTVDRHGMLLVGSDRFNADVAVLGTVRANGFAGSGADLSGIPATALVGTLAPGAIPPIDAATLTGTLNAAQLPADVLTTASTIAATQLPADVLTTASTLSAVQVPALDASKVATGVLDPARIPPLPASSLQGSLVSRGTPSVPLTGLVSVEAGSAAVVGDLELSVGGLPGEGPIVTSATFFTREVQGGDAISIAGETFTVVAVQDDQHLTLDHPHATGAQRVPALRDADPLFAVENGAGRPRLAVDHHGMVTIGDDGFAAGAIVHGPLAVNGEVTANGFSGPGAGLTAVPAAALTGEVPAASIPALDAAKVATGVLDPARVPPVAASALTGQLTVAQLPPEALTTASTLTAAQVPPLDAAKVATGVLDAARIPPIDASTLTGVLSPAQLPPGTETGPIDASHVVSGVFDPARIPELDASKVATGVLDPARVPPVAASALTGQLTVAQLPPEALTTASTLTAAQVPPLDAAKVATGVLDAARIPPIDASKITGVLAPAQLPPGTETGPLDASAIVSGVFDPARIPGLDAAKVATGVLDPARIPPIAAAALTGQLAAAQVPALDAAKVASGVLDPARIPAIDASKITGVLSPAQLPDGGKGGETIDAGQIVSGTLDPARLPSPLTISNGRVGIYEDTPASALQVGATPVNANGYDFGYTPLMLSVKADNGGSVPAPPASTLALVREGVGGQAYANMADFRLSRYEVAGTDARTQLDVALTDGAFAPNTVLSVQSGGRVGIGTRAPKGLLHVSLPVPAVQAGAETLDQSNYANNTSIGVADGSFGQSFTAGITGLLTKVRVQLMGTFGRTSGTVQIYGTGAMAVYRPTGPQLYSGAAAFPDGGWMTAVISPPVPVVAGQQYIFTLQTGFQLNAQLGNNNPYTRGGFLSYDGNTSYDICFETYVQPAAPIPAVEKGLVVMDNGKVGIGTETPSEKLEVNGNVKANAFPTTSDARFKADVGAIDAPLETLSRLRGVRYRWRRDEHPERGFGAGMRLGMVAQEVEPVLPSMVYADADGSRSLEYAQLCALLVEAVKELGEEQARTRGELARLRAWAEERGWTDGG